MQRWRSIARVLACVALTACQNGATIDSVIPLGGACTATSICEDGSLCAEGTCARLCSRTEDCGSGDLVCDEGVCLPARGATCSQASDCTRPGPCENVSGADCVGGQCEYPVRPSASACELASGQVGNQDGFCVGTDCVECILNEHCAPPTTDDPECFTTICSGSVCTHLINALVDCQEDGCVDGVRQFARVCGAAGLCPSVTTDEPCGGFACNASGDACRDVCASDDHCQPSHYCRGDGQCIDREPNGGSCTGAEGGRICESGHCAGGICCDDGDCCNTPTDCPSQYGDVPGEFTTALCSDTTGDTTCQGTYREITCGNNECGTSVIADDRACDPFVRTCANNFLDTPCTNDSDQPSAGCLSACDGPEDCDAGYDCIGIACEEPVGAGDACTGTDHTQGSCTSTSLQCDGGICCSNVAAECCDADADCSGYICDTTASTCKTTCAGGQSDCQSGYLCYNQICYDTLPDGAPCSIAGDCTSNACRTDWDGTGTFCASSATTCVFDTGSAVQFYDNTDRKCGTTDIAGGGDETDAYKTCNNGTWGTLSSECNAGTCDPDGGGSEGSSCGFASDPNNTCESDEPGTNSGNPSGCYVSSCTNCGEFSATSGGCGSTLSACSTTCGATCNENGTTDSGTDVCNSGDSYNRVDRCALNGADCYFADNGATDDTLADDCDPFNCNGGSGACYTDCTTGNQATNCASPNTCSGASCVVPTISNGYACTGGGTPCASGSGNCREGTTAGQYFCAQDSTSCVGAGTQPVTQYSNAAILGCGSGSAYTYCNSGTWSAAGSCGDFLCNSTPNPDACYTTCSNNTVCSGSNVCISSDCAPASGATGPCDSGQNGDCNSGSLICHTTNTCLYPVGSQAPCTNNAHCTTTFCDLSTTGSETGRCCSGSGGGEFDRAQCCDAPADCGGDFCVESVDGVTKNNCSSGGTGNLCENDADCVATTLHCRESTDRCVSGDVGGGCDDDGDCDSANRCRESTTTCTTGDVGVVCDDGDDCDSGAYCYGPWGLCTAGAVGDPCESGTECDSGRCRASTGLCVSGLSGGGCDTGADCYSGTCSTFSSQCSECEDSTDCGGGSNNCCDMVNGGNCFDADAYWCDCRVGICPN